MDSQIKRRKINFGNTSSIYRYKGSLQNIYLGRPLSECCKIRFGHPIVLILSNSNHNPNRKCTCLNATPQMSLSIVKPDSQEAILNNIQNHLKICKGKINWFQNPNKNWIGVQARPLKFLSLIRGVNLFWSLRCYVLQIKKILDLKAASFWTLIRSHEGGVTQPFEKPTTWNNDRVDTQKCTGPPRHLI